MKKLLILILLFASAKAQQKDTINNATITLQNGSTTTTYSNVTIVIPHQSTTGGVSKPYVDSGLATKALQLYVNTAIANLQNSKQNTLTAGNNIQIVNNVISSTGGGSGGGYLPDSVYLPNVTYKNVIFPTNYGVQYSDGKQDAMYIDGYKINDVNGPGTIPDNVWVHWAYGLSVPNLGYQGSIMKNGGLESVSELNFHGMFEHHFRMYDLHGREHRWDGYYGSKETGRAFLNHELDYMALFLAANASPGGLQPFQYASIGQGKITMNGMVGGGLAVELIDPNNQIVKISNEGGVGQIRMNNTVLLNEIGDFKLPFPVFTDNAAARLANRPINSVYKKPDGSLWAVQ